MAGVKLRKISGLGLVAPWGSGEKGRVVAGKCGRLHVKMKLLKSACTTFLERTCENGISRFCMYGLKRACMQKQEN